MIKNFPLTRVTKIIYFIQIKNSSPNVKYAEKHLSIQQYY